MNSDPKNDHSGPFISNDLMKSVLSKIIAEDTSMRSIYLDLLSEDSQEEVLVRLCKKLHNLFYEGAYKSASIYQMPTCTLRNFFPPRYSRMKVIICWEHFLDRIIERW
jgi:hypothetical protein